MEKDKKDLIIENVKKLKERIIYLEDELENKKLEMEERKSVQSKNLCWWDTKPCARYAEISGIQEAGKRCSSCCRVDWKALVCVLEEIASDSYREKIEELTDEVSEAKKEGQEKLDDTMQEINEEISEILKAVDIKPSD